MSISDDTLRLAADLRTQLEQVTNAQTRDIVSHWARAWDDVAGELDRALNELTAAAADGRVTRAMMLRSARLTRALSVVGEQLQQAAHEAGVRIIGDLRTVIADAGRAQHGLITSQLPAEGQALAVSWSHVDPGAIRAIVTRVTKQVHAATKPLAPDAVRQMKAELVRGVAVGANPRVTAQRILARTEGTFNGGLSRALTIARTETLDAHRAGALLARQANADVLQGWRWTTDLSPRTCMACWSMEGTEWPIDEPGPYGHQNCRCTATPVTLSWKDLGFDIPEPASIVPDKQELFDQLTPADQRQVLGTRYGDWQTGRLPMDRWAVRQSNSGWRDSYVPARPSRSARLAS